MELAALITEIILQTDEPQHIYFQERLIFGIKHFYYAGFQTVFHPWSRPQFVFGFKFKYLTNDMTADVILRVILYLALQSLKLLLLFFDTLFRRHQHRYELDRISEYFHSSGIHRSI